MRRPSRTFGRLLAGAALAVAAVAAPIAASAPAQAHTGDPITRHEVMLRAHNWMNRNIQYSQGGTATGPKGKVTYRRDCSGFVSMAWKLKPTGMSAPVTTTLSTSKYTHKIAKKNLKKGDILDSAAHVVLFEKWANKAHTRILLYEEANPSEDMNHYSAPLSKYSGFKAYRYNKIKD
ncbi:hypothetical protein AB0I55_19720 [Actinocatenispora sera]|uniref:hypothetical protein n=1 Tax=Actinocatenispora sera TaxID=390989 RepID=UPI0033D27ED4